MPWKRRSGTDPKYNSREHRTERAKWVRILADRGVVQCMQPVCVMRSRNIYNGDRWHLGHADNGVDYLGPVHAACNVKDGARRGRARQTKRRETTLRW